ncbi:hypothetical protein NP284_18555 [Rhodopseudomonas pseudopalustris]|uniref:hypothetical protein n=1 Tax=Rhodopseudomonas pseudopalustris TaxID=1513892 RepID=UPI003F99CFCC
MSKYVVFGWKAGAKYEKSAESLAVAQVYCEYAKEKGFMDIRVKAPDGKLYTAAEVDEIAASGL